MIKRGPSEKTIFRNLSYPIFVINQKMEVIWCNDAVTQFWERDKNKMLGKSIKMLLWEDQVILAPLQKVLQDGKDFSVNDHLLQVSPHHSKVVSVSMNPVFKKNRKIYQAILTFQDLTYHHQIKAKEREKDILDSIGVFVSSIAHEIQNPLSGIKGVAQLLQRDLKKSQIPTRSTEMILRELGRIDRMVKELLLYSQPIPLQTTVFNLHELLDTVIWFEENSSNSELTFQRQFDPSLPDITADRDKLHQVFLNLIKNATEASPKKGGITIRSSYCPEWEMVDKQLDLHQEYFLIEFEDQGSGIAEAHRDHIFKPLFTTKRQGNGLGLSISFQIIAGHGGLLQYKPAGQQGSVFQVYIPRTPHLS